MPKPLALCRATTLLLALALGSQATAACTAHRTPVGAADLHGAGAVGHRRLSVSRPAAEHAVASVARSVPGLHHGIERCPGGSSCRGVPRTAWNVSARRAGARIASANGISAGAYVAVSRFRDARAARAFVAHLRHQHRRYDGVFSVALEDGRGRRYTPGERGVGTLTAVTRHGWTGWALDMQHSYVFDDASESSTEYTRRFVAQRGRFVCAAFLDGRSLTELRHLVPAWARLLTALDR
jgi:hypothetical protein